MAEQFADKEILELIVKNIVNKPEAVKIERQIDEMGVLLSLKVDPLDMAYVIGRQGMTAKAIRTILKVVGAKHHARVNLKIEEPENSTRGASSKIVDQVVEDLKM